MLKTKTITTDKATLLVVGLPEEAINVYMHQEFIQYESFGVHKFRLPDDNWQLIGRLPDITEDQWKGIVDYFTTDEEFGKEDVFRDYLDRSFFDTAVESGLSLLQANEIYFDNKYAKTLNEAVNKSPKDDYESKLFEADVFRQAQSKVWDKERCYLFIKVDSFYCKEWNNVGYICEEQCYSCRKTNDFKL